MNTITRADLPSEFANVDEAVSLLWIEVATATVDSARWLCAGVDPSLGVKLLASHMLKMTGEGSDPNSTKVVAATVGTHGGSTYGRAFDSLLTRVQQTRRTHLPPAPKP